MIDERIFTRKTFSVRAIQVTAQNMYDVALWCDGRYVIAQNSAQRPYIEVVIAKSNGRDILARAYEGCWITRLVSGEAYFKVYKDKSFAQAFDERVDLFDQVNALVEKAMGGTWTQYTQDDVLHAADITREIIELFEQGD